MSTGAGSTRSKEETLKLIEVWGQENIQKQLQERKRNQTIHEEVAKQMREAGYERTYQQDKEAERRVQKGGQAGKNWRRMNCLGFFDLMYEILGQTCNKATSCH